jgi:hypothetical protein
MNALLEHSTSKKEKHEHKKTVINVQQTFLGWTARVGFPAVQGSSPQRADRLWGLPSLLPKEYRGGKRQGLEADHSPPTSAEVKKDPATPPLPHISSRHSASLIKHRDNFTF